MTAGDMEKMEGLLLDADNRDRGVVVVSSSFSGRITAQHNPLKSVALWYAIITPEPGRFDHVALGRRRVLLVLGGKHAAADLAPQFVDCRGAVAFRLQQLPGGTVIDLFFADHIVGRFDGDRG